jgi:hypothetical protein
MWMPYEPAFSLVGGKDCYIVDIDQGAYREFVVKFAEMLREGGFEGALGLRPWPSGGFRVTLEFTPGKTNITLKQGECELVESEEIGYTTTMWFFDEAFMLAACRCVCRYGRHGSHIGHYHESPKGHVGEVSR